MSELEREYAKLVIKMAESLKKGFEPEKEDLTELMNVLDDEIYDDRWDTSSCWESSDANC